MRTLQCINALTEGDSTTACGVRLTDIYQPDHPMSVLQRTIDDELGGVLTMNVIVALAAPDGDRDPEVLERLAEMQRRIGQLYGVASTRSIADFVAAMHRSLAGENAGR